MSALPILASLPVVGPALRRLDPASAAALRSEWLRSKLSRGRASNADIVQLLVLETLRRGVPSRHGLVVPSEIRFGLAVVDHAQLRGLVVDIERQVECELLRVVAHARGVTPDGRFRVRVYEDLLAERGEPIVTARIGLRLTDRKVPAAPGASSRGPKLPACSDFARVPPVPGV